MPDSTDTSETTEGSLRFGVDAGLLFQLGEQLVARRSVALSELIKNAYDADATEVSVLLEDVTKPNGSIIVQDNGTGMTFEQVRDHWMRVATDAKRREPYSPIAKRPRTGEKGVGRFATRRLGHKLTLVSVAERPEGDREEVTVEFDWAGRFKHGLSLDTIDVDYSRRPVPNDYPTGTVVYVEDTRDRWTEDDMAALRKDLVALVNPFAGSKLVGDVRPEPKQDPDGSAEPDQGGSPPESLGFKVKLEAPEFPDYEGEVTDYFLTAAWATLAGVVEADGSARYRIKIRETGEDLTHETDPGTFSSIPKAEFVIFYFVYKGDLFGEFNFGSNDARRIGRSVGGVRIYLDDFRVFPYGDPQDDWLRLNEMRASRTPQLLRRNMGMKEAAGLPASERPELLVPGNNQLFGAVEISRFDQPAIEVNVSRERLTENDAFEELRGFVSLGIYWMTVQYSRVTLPEREARRQDRRESAAVKAEDAEGLLRKLKDQIGDDPSTVIEQLPQIKEAVDALGAQIRDVRDSAESELRDRISERAMLRVLASTGTAVSVVTHQLEGVTEGADSIATDVREAVEAGGEDVRVAFEPIVGRVEGWKELVEKQVGLLGFLLGRNSKDRRRRVTLRPFVGNLADGFSAYRQRLSVEFTNAVPGGLRTPPLYEAELGAILLNAYTNSLKALRDVDPSRRHFGVSAEASDGEFRLYVFDTGPGIPEADWERVFEPFVSTSEPDPVLGAGTGLGLMVVADLLSEYGGRASFVDPRDVASLPPCAVPWATVLQVSLPLA